jgi:hypothetical protein
MSGPVASPVVVQSSTSSSQPASLVGINSLSVDVWVGVVVWALHSWPERLSCGTRV